LSLPGVPDWAGFAVLGLFYWFIEPDKLKPGTEIMFNVFETRGRPINQNGRLKSGPSPSFHNKSEISIFGRQFCSFYFLQL
jgi:hypothetical protein